VPLCLTWKLSAEELAATVSSRVVMQTRRYASEMPSCTPGEIVLQSEVGERATTNVHGHKVHVLSDRMWVSAYSRVRVRVVRLMVFRTKSARREQNIVAHGSGICPRRRA
jgi:hypothetical protein